MVVQSEKPLRSISIHPRLINLATRISKILLKVIQHRKEPTQANYVYYNLQTAKAHVFLINQSINGGNKVTRFQPFMVYAYIYFIHFLLQIKQIHIHKLLRLGFTIYHFQTIFFFFWQFRLLLFHAVWMMYDLKLQFYFGSMYDSCFGVKIN